MRFFASHVCLIHFLLVLLWGLVGFVPSMLLLCTWYIYNGGGREARSEDAVDDGGAGHAEAKRREDHAEEDRQQQERHDRPRDCDHDCVCGEQRIAACDEREKGGCAGDDKHFGER